MTTITEGKHPEDFLLSEGNGAISREEVTIASGQTLDVGDVVGQITASEKYAIYDNGAGDGTETAAGIVTRAVDASAADQQAVIINLNAEVNGDELGWNGQSQAAIDAGIADLLALGIKVRTGY